MIKMQINIRAYLTLILVYLLFTTVSASAQTKQEIVEAWQQQIKSFKTLQLDYEASVYNLMDPFGADALFTLKHKFALSGGKYYIYLKFPSGRDFTAMASAYNGDYYQKLMDEKGKMTVYRTKKEDNSAQPYLSPHPLTIQYQFAFMPDAPRTIGTLKKSETWERLAERITEIQPSTRNGQHGFTVDIEIPESKKIYQVFVGEKTFWPRHWSLIDRFQDNKNKMYEEVGEMDVNTVTSVGEKDTALMFPSQIILQDTRNGRLVTQALINTVPESLKINEPVPDDIFTIAPPNATLIDVDEQERRFQEKRNSSKETAQLPRAEDDPQNKIAAPQATVKVGQAAPDFFVTDANGKAWKLSDLKGKKTVLLTFFPKCFTGGCANHLSSLRDHQTKFDKAKVQIFAVSVDPAEGERGQKAFAAQWHFLFPLIPDTERMLCKLYGAVQQNDERAARMTFLIDKQGIVRFIDTDVHVQTHGADTLAKLRELKITE
jgi:peroxiredoxin